MDRRHRALLRTGAVVAAAAGMLAVVDSGELRAQPSPGPAQNQGQQAAQSQPTPAAQQPPPVPAGSATPWVQASPPVTLTQQTNAIPTPTATAAATATPSPKPTPIPTPKPTAPKPAPFPAVPKPTAARAPATPAPFDAAAPSAEETKAKMLRERERELNALPQSPFGQPALTDDEQMTFQNNARLWNKLLPEEQQAILGQAGRRIREETEQAYGQTGLNLNDDQREVFALRYRQERRRLERELQDKANNERSRRVPLILEQLKREFGKMSASPAAPRPSSSMPGSEGGGNVTPKGSPVASPAQPPPSATVNGGAPGSGNGAGD